MFPSPHNLTPEELASFDLIYTEDEWNSTCKRIKAARNGAYPPDWYDKIICSGMIDRVSARWGGKAEIKVSAIGDNGELKPVDTFKVGPPS